MTDLMLRKSKGRMAVARGEGHDGTPPHRNTQGEGRGQKKKNEKEKKNQRGCVTLLSKFMAAVMMRRKQA